MYVTNDYNKELKSTNINKKVVNYISVYMCASHSICWEKQHKVYIN